MKVRIASILLTILLFLAVVAPSNTLAADRLDIRSIQTNGPIVQVGSVSGDADEIVEIPVTISGNTGFAGFTFEVFYPDGLTLTKVTKGTLLAGSDSGALAANVSKNLINWNDVENLLGNGEMFVLTFHIQEETEAGSYTVFLQPKDGKPGNFVDENGSPVSATFRPGTITVREHVHQYTDTVISPTCTEQGYTTHTCNICGYSYIDTYVAALDHNWSEWVETTPPTPTEPGEEIRTCIRCGLTETRFVDPLVTTVTVCDASARSGDIVTVPVIISANPGFAGFTWEVSCPEELQLTLVTKGAILNSSDSGALSFNPAKGLINWTDAEDLRDDGQLFVLSFHISEMAEPGNYPVSISLKDEKPGNFIDENGIPIDATFEPGLVTVQAHEHQYEALVIPPTCMEQGFTTHTCSICGSFYVDTYVDALGHDLVHHEAKAPSCTEPGWNAYDTCSRCEYTTYEEIPASCPGEIFIDMPARGHWAHDAIDWAITLGVTAGTTETTFAPNMSATRAQVVTILWRASGSPEPISSEPFFTDVANPNSYYFKAVQWAYEKEITNGVGESTFGVNRKCSRAQIVTFLWRFAGSPEPTQTENQFSDVSPDSYYFKAVLWANQNGITAGTSGSAFSPNMNCTRAQIVTFLWRFLNG